jgi:hypothetical protein
VGVLVAPQEPELPQPCEVVLDDGQGGIELAVLDAEDVELVDILEASADLRQRLEVAVIDDLDEPVDECPVARDSTAQQTAMMIAAMPMPFSGVLMRRGPR